MRPLFSPDADLPALRARLEQWDRMGRYMDRGFTRQDSQISSIYRSIARKTAAKLATKARDHSAAFPNIVIQNN